jgi:hypothetical protein
MQATEAFDDWPYSKVSSSARINLKHARMDWLGAHNSEGGVKSNTVPAVTTVDIAENRTLLENTSKGTQQ